MYVMSLGLNWKLTDGVEFVKLKQCLDNCVKETASMGLGRDVKSAQALYYSDIDKMWESGILGEDSPAKLSDTILFLLGLNCVLRSGHEHKNLRRPGCDSQFEIVTIDGAECLKYTEDLSTKTNRGGLKHVRIPPKQVVIYPASNPDRCPVHLFQKYVSKLPKY